jgi:hypothetical protein
VPGRSLVRIALAVIALTAAAPPAGAQVTTVFSPAAHDGFVSPGVMYARAVTLHHNGDANGTIVATFETYSNKTPHFPVLESTDGGASWTRISTVVDTVHGYGMRWNPQIYELPERLGSLPAGTLLVAGLSVPRDMSSTHILMYASTDKGRTWRFASSIATGGAAYALDPFTPVWEPFLLMHDGKLIVLYSDQRENPRYSQKLVHQVSSDGIEWGPLVDDVTYAYQEARPGMPTVAPIGRGRWILTYEVCDTRGGECPVAYRSPATRRRSPRHPRGPSCWTTEERRRAIPTSHGRRAASRTARSSSAAEP